MAELLKESLMFHSLQPSVAAAGAIFAGVLYKNREERRRLLQEDQDLDIEAIKHLEAKITKRIDDFVMVIDDTLEDAAEKCEEASQPPAAPERRKREAVASVCEEVSRGLFSSITISNIFIQKWT